MNRRNVIWLGVGATASGATAHFPQFALAQEECSGDVPGLNSIRAYGSYPEARAELLERAWKNTQAGYNVVEDSPDKIVVAPGRTIEGVGRWGFEGLIPDGWVTL